MFHNAIFKPEIPSNIGNIIRLCANRRIVAFNSSARILLDEKCLQRAGLDYHEWATIIHYDITLKRLKTYSPNTAFWPVPQRVKRFTLMCIIVLPMFFIWPRDTRLTPTRNSHLIS